MKQGRSLTDLAGELDRQLHTKRDFVTDTRTLHMQGVSNELLLFPGETRSSVMPLERFKIAPHAHRQIAERLGIPFKYYERMQKHDPELLQHNVNAWLEREPDRRMLRTLDGNLRAFMSDRYHRIDNYDVAQLVLAVVRDHLHGHIQLQSCELTDSRMYLKFTTPRLEGEVARGDIVQAGLAISNSEVGLGAFKVEPLLFRLACLNGMITAQAMRRYHVGKKVDEDGEITFADDTQKADDAAFLLKVRDVMLAAVSEEVFQKNLSDLRETKERPINGNPVKAVETLTKRGLLSGEEEGGVLRQLINGADLTQFGLIQAVTRHSQDVVDYDRATELEQLGGRLIVLSQGEWREIAEAA